MTQIAMACIAKPTYWLKTYLLEVQTAGTFKVSEKAVQTNIWTYIFAIQVLKGQKVCNFLSFTSFTMGNVSNIFLLLYYIDTTIDFLA